MQAMGDVPTDTDRVPWPGHVHPQASVLDSTTSGIVETACRRFAGELAAEAERNMVELPSTSTYDRAERMRIDPADSSKRCSGDLGDLAMCRGVGSAELAAEGMAETSMELSSVVTGDISEAFGALSGTKHVLQVLAS